VLRDQGNFAKARENYLSSLDIKRQLRGDTRGEGVVLGQLGTLALREGDLAEAVKSYHEALKLFQRLNEPLSQAAIHHQLGVALYLAKQWDEAETSLRRAAELKVSQGLFVGRNSASTTWNMLALLNQQARRPEAAETWFRKVIGATRQVGEKVTLSIALSNLAALLAAQLGRRAEARQLAEESLAIKKTLDPGAAEIWVIYTILADIADKEGKPDQSAEYHRLARDAKRAFAGTAHEMRQFLPLILGTCQAIQNPEEAAEFNNALSAGEEGEWANLVGAIRRILSGERNRDALCNKLDFRDAMIVETILDGLENPAILQTMLPVDMAASS
jgi:tetratricopeptide (TPR) repeat protein